MIYYIMLYVPNRHAFVAYKMAKRPYEMPKQAHTRYQNTAYVMLTEGPRGIENETYEIPKQGYVLPKQPYEIQKTVPKRY